MEHKKWSWEDMPALCKKAEEGDCDAQYQAAQFLMETCPGRWPQDVTRYLTSAMEEGGSPQAALALGKHLWSSSPKEAVEALKNAADTEFSGRTEAMQLLGECYAKGHGVACDKGKAEQWLEKAARRQGKDALLKLAQRFETGDGVGKSIVKAMALRESARSLSV